MKITDALDVTLRNSSDLIITDLTHGRIILCAGEAPYAEVRAFYDECRANVAQSDRENFFNAHHEIFDNLFGVAVAVATPPPELTPAEYVERGMNGLIDFFKEFAFTPNFRFVNSLAHALSTSPKMATAYVENYFRLIDSPYAVEVRHKMSSDEFKMILADLAKSAPTHRINNRFKVYYGDAGTGKTTIAQRECENRCIVCNNSMLPSDLMEDFIFDNGKPSFKPSILWDCMTNGKPIVLDEMNLLPFDSLRFLQGILDNKKEFVYKGHTVTIADGFQIIATMNLVVNGAVFNLPEPLVDRSAEIKEFHLSAKQLVSAIMGVTE